MLIILIHCYCLEQGAFAATLKLYRYLSNLAPNVPHKTKVNRDYSVAFENLESLEFGII